MPRYYEIPGAFANAITREPSGLYKVTTLRFINELTKVNHHFSPSEANEWIKLYEPGWRLHEEGDHGFNTYTRFNPN